MLDFEEIIKQLGPKLSRRAEIMSKGNHTFAEEALQDTFIAAWKNQAQFDGKNVGGWLHTILHNKIVDARRPKRRNSFLHHSIQHLDGDVKEGFESLAVSDPEPEAKNLFEIVTNIINTLPAEYVPILKMRLLDNLPQKEIAARLGMPLGTVMSRGFRIMKTLREQLTKQLATA